MADQNSWLMSLISALKGTPPPQPDYGEQAKRALGVEQLPRYNTQYTPGHGFLAPQSDVKSAAQLTSGGYANAPAMLVEGDPGNLPHISVQKYYTPPMQRFPNRPIPNSSGLTPAQLKEWGIEHGTPEDTFNERFGAVSQNIPSEMPTFTPPARVPLPRARPAPAGNPQRPGPVTRGRTRTR